MNSILSSRKLIHAAGYLSLSAFTILAVGVAFDAFPLALFSLSASLLVFLIALHDYADPRAARRVGAGVRSRSERMPLAA
jgi:hypothetical protein